MKPTQTATVFQNWRQTYPIRPGALDHEKLGSRQPDGSVRPYRPPTFGCVGKLASSSQKLDATIIKQHKEKRK